MRHALAAGFILVYLLGFPLPSVRGAEYSGVKVTKVLTGSTAANGQKLSYLRTDAPEVTAAVVEIPPGGETGWHSHSVPVYAYMLSGAIAVEISGGEKFVFKEGEAIFEVMNTPHNGRTVGTAPARLVVFYLGEIGRPNVSRTGDR